MVPGKAVAFGLDGLQERADLFIEPGDEVYEGMVCGENARSEDMTVNPTKEKKLTNMRASGSDRNILLKPPRRMSLEEALEYIEDDELVEVTPGGDPAAEDPALRARAAEGLAAEGHRDLTHRGCRTPYGVTLPVQEA